MLTIPSGDFDCVTEGEFEETRELKCEMSCPRSHSWQEVEVRLERHGVCTTPGESCLFCGLWEIGCERGSAVLIASCPPETDHERKGLDRVREVNQAKGL